MWSTSISTSWFWMTHATRQQFILLSTRKDVLKCSASGVQVTMSSDTLICIKCCTQGTRNAILILYVSLKARDIPYSYLWLYWCCTEGTRNAMYLWFVSYVALTAQEKPYYLMKSVKSYAVGSFPLCPMFPIYGIHNDRFIWSMMRWWQRTL